MLLDKDEYLRLNKEYNDMSYSKRIQETEITCTKGSGDNYKGIYDNKQIISSSWIEEMTKPRIVESNNFRGMEYGYLWWINNGE